MAVSHRKPVDDATVFLSRLDHGDEAKIGELLALDEAQRLLPAAERKRCMSATAVRSGRVRLAAHVALRLALRTQAEKDCAGAQMTWDANGKPHIAGFPFFNMAHTAGMSLIGICRECEVGVDIERLRPVAVDPQTRERLIEQAIAYWPRTLQGVSENARFLAAWTVLEAVTKAAGEKLPDFLDTLRSGLPLRDAASQYPGPLPHAAAMTRPLLPAGFIGACCTAASRLQIMRG